MDVNSEIKKYEIDIDVTKTEINVSIFNFQLTSDEQGNQIVAEIAEHVFEVDITLATGKKGDKGDKGDPGITVSVNNKTEVDGNITLTQDDIPDGDTYKQYSNTEKTKLDGIESGAEVNVQPDWNQADNESDDYIKNKPTLGTASAADTSDFAPALGADDNYVTDAEKIVIGNTSGENTGDQSASDFDIKDLTDSTNLRTTWSGKQNALGFTPENSANKSIDGTLATNSDTLYPSEKAVKTYADQLIAAANAVVYKGATDCSGNPNYPTADAGWIYFVSVAGKIGGASGIVVEVGDMYICKDDSTSAGDQATVGTHWNVIQKNIADYIIGPASVTDATIPLFDGVTGKLLKGSAYTPSSFATAAQGSLADTALQSVTAHNLLSATHGDTTASACARGSVIVGDSNSKWVNLAFPDSPTGKVLQATATDVAWSSSALGTAAFTASTAYEPAVTWGDGLANSAGTASVDFNTTNLKITSTQLNTIQDISTTGSPTFANITDSGLTATRVPYAGVAGILQDSSTFYYNGTTLFVTALSFTAATSVIRDADDGVFYGKITGDAANRFAITASGDITWGDGTNTRDVRLYRSAANVLTTPDAFTAASLTASSLTSGRVPYTSTNGILVDSANLAYNGTNLTVGTVVVPTISSTSTLTNKRIDPRATAYTTASGPTPNVSTTDLYILTAENENCTFGAPTGTPVQGTPLTIRIYGSSVKTIAWNAIYRAIGVTLPTATVTGKTIYIKMQYNSTDTKWDVLQVNIEE